MNAGTRRFSLAGPAGSLECAMDLPDGEPCGLALVCHPHPVHGGTMDNKVVQTLARAFVALGLGSVRFNFRGVGASQGSWDGGDGEIDDAMAVLAAQRAIGPALVIAGFSFGGFVASQVAARLRQGPADGAADGAAGRVVLVAPAVQNFAVAAVPADAVVIHGEADDVVPLAALLDWARPQSLPVTVLPGAGHFFHGQLAVLKQIVTTAFVGGAGVR
jgi:alpha/beta superfamily hydrolase